MVKNTIAYIILGIIFIFSVFILFLVITGFNPDDITILNVNNNQVNIIEAEDSITLLTYSIGHGGLDSENDYYSYGGDNTRASSYNQVIENMEGIIETIDDINPDVFLLQDIDINSRRSYYTNQLEYFNKKYPNYSYTFGKNKDIGLIPFPIHKPVGRIKSGLATFSKFSTLEGVRYSLPKSGNFLSNIFEYKWSITKTIFETDIEGDLVVINLKLSPYSEGDFMREEQLNFLRLFLEEEYRKGNHVVVGGDYNHNLPGVDPFNFRYKEEWPSWLKNIPDDYEVNNFTWKIDESRPTFRNLSNSFKKGRNFVAVTDGFLVSDNIEVQEVVTFDDGFQNSNHNPVFIKLRLLSK